MKDLTWIQIETDKYVKQLINYIHTYDLKSLLQKPVDHFAIKLENTSSYEEFLEYILPFCNSAQYINMNNRRIATAELMNGIFFGQFGTCPYIEIMEPRPEKVGQDLVGFEHTELVFDNLEEIESQLKAKNITYEKYDNGFHKACVLQINTIRQEVKLTDSKLVTVLKNEKKEGKLISLK